MDDLTQFIQQGRLYDDWHMALVDSKINIMVRILFVQIKRMLHAGLKLLKGSGIVSGDDLISQVFRTKKECRVGIDKPLEL